MLILHVTALEERKKAECELAGRTEIEESGGTANKGRGREMQERVLQWKMFPCAHVYIKAKGAPYRQRE